MFFDFGDQAKANATGYFPYTPALPMLYGLREALACVEDEGLENVFARHRRLADSARAAVKAWGLTLCAKEEKWYSDTVSAVMVPDGVNGAEVIDIARILLDGGWEVHRVLRGPTRRECTAHPVLDTLAPAMAGLWRLLVRKADPSRAESEGPGGPSRKGEVWYLADLPPEGRAGVPQLLLEDWQRVVVVPLEPELLANVFRWTGHFPERTRVLVRYLADRAEQLRQGYAVTRESAAIVAFTTFVTGLAMNHVQRGSYLP